MFPRFCCVSFFPKNNQIPTQTPKFNPLEFIFFSSSLSILGLNPRPTRNQKPKSNPPKFVIVPIGISSCIVATFLFTARQNATLASTLFKQATLNLNLCRNITRINLLTVRVDDRLNRHHLRVTLRHGNVPSIIGTHENNTFQLKAHTQSNA